MQNTSDKSRITDHRSRISRCRVGDGINSSFNRAVAVAGINNSARLCRGAPRRNCRWTRHRELLSEPSPLLPLFRASQTGLRYCLRQERSAKKTARSASRGEDWPDPTTVTDATQLSRKRSRDCLPKCEESPKTMAMTKPAKRLTAAFDAEHGQRANH